MKSFLLLSALFGLPLFFVGCDSHAANTHVHGPGEHAATSLKLNFYPLGSCTMKYNPKINVTLLCSPGFTRAHPHLPEADLQGHIELMYNLESYLREISGFPAVTLQPAAGAHGEMTGVMVIKAYFEEKGEGKTRTEIVIPDSAHGTNPATAALAGFKTVTLKGKPDGSVDVELLKTLVGPQTAAMMITNPSTLGLLEPNMVEIAKILHAHGAQLYMDGANMNAIQGIVRPADYGVDVMHFNLHKTYSVPHGAGPDGPNSSAARPRSTIQSRSTISAPLRAMSARMWFVFPQMCRRGIAPASFAAAKSRCS